MSHKPGSDAEKLLELLARETTLSFSLEEVICPRRQYAVLMGKMYAPYKPGTPQNRLRERLSLREATEFMRGLLLGFKLGAGRIRPGPETLRHLRGEPEGVEAPGKD
jgi:hypothetical protein